MKTKILKSLLVFVLTTASTVVLAAGATTGRLSEYTQALDDTVQRVKNIQDVTGELGKALKIDPAVVQRAMLEKQCSLSDIAMAKLVADKSGQSLETLLVPNLNWTDIITQNQITENEAVEYLDAYQSEIAFVLLDYKQNKKK